MFKIIQLSFIITIWLPLFSQQSNSIKLDSFFETIYSNNKAMGSIAVRQNGTLIYSNSIGFISRNNESLVNANSNTSYRIGSITKMYTAAMIFHLIEKGKLDMETLLNEYFPNVPNSDKIKIKHLLGHTSGIFNITSDSTYQKWYQSPIKSDEMLKLIVSHQTEFEPGTKKQYSNSNYILLGYILELITNKSYQKNLDIFINSKTGAKYTKYGSSIDVANNEAKSFSYENKEWIVGPETNMRIPGGAGAICATADEVALFAEKYFGGYIVNQQWLDTVMMIKRQLGYGVIKFDVNGEVGYGHNGAIDGFNSMVVYIPSTKTSIAFLSNGINFSIDEIIQATYKICTGSSYTIPSFKTIQLSETALNIFKGVYSSDAIDLKITITGSNEVLMLQADGQPAFALDAITSTTFSIDQIGIALEYIMNSDGTVKEMILKQGGGELVFRKLNI